MLHVKLLTSPHISLKGTSLSSTLVGRGLALFAYIAANKAPIARSKLLDLLWGDITEKQAQENVRVLLYNVRRILGDYISVTRSTVELNRRLPYWSDLDAFASITDERVRHDPILLAQILDLYEQDFLDGFYIANAPVFDTWLAEQRNYLRNKTIAGWQQLTEIYWAEKRYEESISANERLLALAPWHEEAHQRHMRLLMATGRRSAALAQYETCCRQLNETLDSPPSLETTKLYEQIKEHPIAPKGDMQALVRPQQSISTESTLSLALGTMPTQSWFVGRQAELKTLHQWTMAEQCRAVSILGMGGQGKTALAAAFVKTVVEMSSDTKSAFAGIIWHSVQRVPPLEDILRQWIDHLSDGQVTSLPPTLDRQVDLLIGYLKKKRFLFVLDGAESVLACQDSEQKERYNDYVQLWRCFVEQDHQSCLLIVGREWITDRRNHYERPTIYRRMILDGLDPDAGRQLLTRHGLQLGADDGIELQQIYAGNPSMLDLAGQTIDELFFGDVRSFLSENAPFLGEIGVVCEEQFSKLTRLEQEILTWLALEGRPVSADYLWSNLLTHPSKHKYFIALSRQLGRSLILQQGSLFGVPDLVMQYARQRLLERLYKELTAVSKQLDSASSIRVTAMQLNRYDLQKLQADTKRVDNKIPFLAAWQKRLHRFWGGPHSFTKAMQRLLTALDEEAQQGAPLTAGYARANIRLLTTGDLWSERAKNITRDAPPSEDLYPLASPVTSSDT